MEQQGEPGCVFCEIVAGRRPASVVHQNERCWAFMDIRPVNPGHVLVIPVHHAAGLSELDPEDGAELFRMAQKVAQALRSSGVRCEGVNLHLADGRAAGQEVFHVHLHVVPRFRGDGFGLRFGPDYGRMPPRAELDALAAQLKAHLQAHR
ncbi:MAG: HIT family protein [candidate division KSB1 bacterium]|nr:HIT family protein [candidate division KSB1 bacterium]MDZ7378315.1 HIT family protein [candidate division KSB1 bacterium]MDZ7385922.1 HIT family protein [candidate division KSB1 bacterium]MDZ7392673.1 HIT family protein [candidate division KSB1 bacterium]MDZ7412941.1 HIT family protein [candidate division KSB1 bacterium]